MQVSWLTEPDDGSANLMRTELNLMTGSVDLMPCCRNAASSTSGPSVRIRFTESAAVALDRFI
jgi:hypothetical protein